MSRQSHCQCPLYSLANYILGRSDGEILSATEFVALYKDEWTNMAPAQKETYRVVAEELRNSRVLTIKKTGALAVLDVTKTWETLVNIVSLCPQRKRAFLVLTPQIGRAS